MPTYTVPLATTQVFVLPTTADYDLVMSWLNAPDLTTKRQRGMETVTGNRDDLTITVTAVQQTTDIDTDIPIVAL